jgi:hypothetical protein
MKKRLADIAYRRSKLLDRIEMQRADVAEFSLRWHKPVALAEMGLKAARLVYAHPAVVTGIVAALLTFRRKGAVALVRSGWRLLFLYPSAVFLGLKYLTSATRHNGIEDE